MPAPARSPAALAESLVADALRAAGWELLARNLRTPWAEVDLLAVDPRTTLVVVEVKARHPLSWARGEQALGLRQRRRLARAAEGCARRLNWPGALRVDLADVELVAGRPSGWRLLRGVELFEEGVERA